MGKSRLYSSTTKIGSRVAVQLHSGETIIGRLLNIEFRDGGSLILSDAEKEFKTKKNPSIIKRSYLGFVIIRSSSIVSIGGHGDNASPVGASNHTDSLVVGNNNAANSKNNQNQKSGGNSGAINYAQIMKETNSRQ